MTHSPVECARYKDARWLKKRAQEELAQVQTVRWWNTEWRTLGVSDPRLLCAYGAWLGKPGQNAFFILKRLHELGYCFESPRLLLSVARGGLHGLTIYFEDIDAHEAPEARSMKSILANEGYEVITARNSAGAVRAIVAYLESPGIQVPDIPLTEAQGRQKD